MMRRASIIGATLLGLIVAAVKWRRVDADPPPAAPLIHVGTPSIDLGTVPLTDDHLHFEYKIDNWGQAPLRIEGTILSCGCTQPSIPQADILPNQSAPVHLKIDPEAAGEKRVSVTLITNDPANPRFTLFAQWVATNGISVDPPNLDFGDVEAGRSSSLPVKISKLDDRIRIASATGEPESLQATLTDGELTVALTPEAYPASGYGVVRLEIEGGHTRPLLIPVRWHVDHAYQAFPSSLFLGYAQPGDELVGVIGIKDRDSRNIAASHWEWKEELSGTHCETTQDEQGRDQFSVRWTAPEKPGLHRGVVTLTVADHTLLVPVSALVGTGKQ